MKKISFILILIMTTTIASGMNAQDLSKFKEGERNKKLIEIAKTEYSKEKYKEYYRMYDVPKITKKIVKDIPSLKNSGMVGYGSTPGDIFYMVEFPYDHTKDRFEAKFACRVYIWEKTGRVFGIELGNRFLLKVE